MKNFKEYIVESSLSSMMQPIEKNSNFGARKYKSSGVSLTFTAQSGFFVRDTCYFLILACPDTTGIDYYNKLFKGII